MERGDLWKNIDYAVCYGNYDISEKECAVCLLKSECQLKTSGISFDSTPFETLISRFAAKFAYFKTQGDDGKTYHDFAVRKEERYLIRIYEDNGEICLISRLKNTSVRVPYPQSCIDAIVTANKYL